MCVRAAVFCLLILGAPALGLAQEKPHGFEAQSSAIPLVTEPPGPAQEPTEDIGPLRPGEVILHGAPVRVRFRSPTAGVSFMLKSGTIHTQTKGWSLDLGIIFSKEGSAFDPGFGVYSADIETREYVPICTGGCEATLPAGTHRIALSLDGGKPLEPRRPTRLTRDSIVEGRYKNRRAVRIVGWVLWGVGSVTGTMMMLLSTNDTEELYTLDIRNKAAFYAGVGLTLVSFGVGIPLIVQKDKAVIKVYPLK